MEHPKRIPLVERRAMAKLSQMQKEILVSIYQWQSMLEALAALPGKTEAQRHEYQRYLKAGLPMRADNAPRAYRASLSRSLAELETRGLIQRVYPSFPERSGTTFWVFPLGDRPDLQPTNVHLTQLGKKVVPRLRQERGERSAG